MCKNFFLLIVEYDKNYIVYFVAENYCYAGMFVLLTTLFTLLQKLAVGFCSHITMGSQRFLQPALHILLLENSSSGY